MSNEYTRRLAYIKRKRDLIDPDTGKEEWESEFDREEIYENPFP